MEYFQPKILLTKILYLHNEYHYIVISWSNKNCI